MSNNSLEVENVVDTLTNFIGQVLDIPDENLTPEMTQGLINTIMNQVVITDEIVQKTKEEIKQGKSNLEVIKKQFEDYDEQVKGFLDELDIKNPNKKAIIETMFAAINDLSQGIIERIENSVDTIVHFQLTHPNAKIPTYAHKTDAGADVYLPEDVVVPAQARGMIIDVGFKMAMAPGWEMQVRPRSGLSHKTALRVSNAPGTIDADYRNNVGILVDNLSNEPISLKAGDRIAQLVISPSYHFSAKQVEDVSTIGDDRKGGFGSTGA